MECYSSAATWTGSEPTQKADPSLAIGQFTLPFCRSLQSILPLCTPHLPPPFTMTTSSTPPIIATAQQSRFDSALVDPTSIAELELATVNIAIGQHEILVDTEIKFKDGLKYALVGP